MKEYKIYCILNKINNKKYIGQTCQKFEYRINRHFNDLKKNIHTNEFLQRSYNKYGKDAFEYFILENNINNLNESNNREKHYIDFYNTLNEENGYNLMYHHSHPIEGVENNQKCSDIKLTDEMKNEMSKFNSDEDFLRSGGFSIEALDRAAFGFSSEDIKTLKPNQLNIKWKDDYENVIYEQNKSGLSKIEWANRIKLNEPIDVIFEKNKFFIDDGHHRFYAAKILNKPLNVNLTIKQNPLIYLNKDLSYDDFHRCAFSIFNKQTQLEGMEISKKDLIQNWLNNPKMLKEDAEDANFVDEITKGELEEAKKKKGDRCTRIAKRKYDVWPSAYASGAVVKCRQGKIWKGLSEEEEKSLEDNYPKELINKAHDAITRRKGKDYAPDVHELQAWIDKYQESLNEKWSEKYKRSIDCNNPKGFSQKAHCQGRLKENWEDTSWSNDGEEVTLKDLLNLIKDYPIVKAPIEKVKKIIIKKDSGGIDSNRLNIADFKYPIIIIVDNNGNYKYILDGNHRANKAIDNNLKYIPAKLVNIENLPKEFQNVLGENESLDEKTDFSKEKSKGLHGWFERQGGSGKSKGWVDCNTCRTVDGKKKCKTCGRQEGEKRSKYPACRPTPSACGSKGKGKSWGKKSANEDVLNEQSKQDIERELKLNEIKSLFQRHIGKL